MEHCRKQLVPCPPPVHHVELDLPIRLADGIEPLKSSASTGTARKGTRASPKSVKKVVASNTVEDSSSPIESESEVDEVAVEESVELDGKSKALVRTRRRITRKTLPLGSRHPLVEMAEDRALSYLADHPKARAPLSSLRAYFLWHKSEIQPAVVASLLRDPPLTESTVITYVLAAIKYQKLPYDAARLHVELAQPLSPRLRPNFPEAVEAIRNSK